MGIFDFFKGKKKDQNKKKQSRNVADSFDKKPVDLTVPAVENGILKTVYNHHIKNGTFFVPRNAHTIVSFAFVNCDNLETLVLHDTVRFIDTGAFSSCKNLNRIVGLEEQCAMKTIDGFARCGKLESVRLPGTIEVIKNGAFKDCSRLKSINIPGNCWCIGDHAFENCKSLQSVELSKNVTMIGKDAFKGCYDLAVLFTNEFVEDKYTVNFPEASKDVDLDLEIDKGAFSGVKAVYAYDMSVIEKVIASGFRGQVSYYDKEQEQIITIDLNMIENLYFDSVQGEDEEEIEMDVALIDELYKAKFGEPTAEELAEEERLMREEQKEKDEDELGDE